MLELIFEEMKAARGDIQALTAAVVALTAAINKLTATPPAVALSANLGNVTPQG